MKCSLTMTAASMVLALAVAACAQQAPAADVATSVEAPLAATAARVDNFRLVTADGYARELYRYKEAPAIVLVMGGAGDMAKVGPELAKIESAYKAKGVEFFVVNSNPKAASPALGGFK